MGSSNEASRAQAVRVGEVVAVAVAAARGGERYPRRMMAVRGRCHACAGSGTSICHLPPPGRPQMGVETDSVWTCHMRKAAY
jgi:hypothetical protein